MLRTRNKPPPILACDVSRKALLSGDDSRLWRMDPECFAAAQSRSGRLGGSVTNRSNTASHGCRRPTGEEPHVTPTEQTDNGSLVCGSRVRDPWRAQEYPGAFLSRLVRHRPRRLRLTLCQFGRQWVWNLTLLLSPSAWLCEALTK